MKRQLESSYDLDNIQKLEDELKQKEKILAQLEDENIALKRVETN